MYTELAPDDAATLNAYLSQHDGLREASSWGAVLEPRRVQSPAGFHSVKCVASGLFLLLANSRLRERLGKPLIPSAITAHGIAYEVIRRQVPLYFVREEFLRAVMATDLPTDFTLDDLHWPLPGLVLAFPPHVMREFVGRETCFVYAANCDAGEHPAPAGVGGPAVVLPRSKVGWFWFAMGPHGLETFVTSFFRDERVDQVITRNGYTDYTGIKASMDIADDHAATDRVSTLMLKLLVVLNTRPGFVETGGCVRPEKRKHGRIKQHALWSPNLIGWHYVQSKTVDGTHAKPRMHWRRGHVRNQPHGPGRTLRRLIWVEPVLVGAPENSANPACAVDANG